MGAGGGAVTGAGSCSTGTMLRGVPLRGEGALTASCAKLAAQGRASAMVAARARILSFAVDVDAISLREFVVRQNLFNIVLCRAHIGSIKRQCARTHHHQYHEGDQQLPTHCWTSP